MSKTHFQREKTDILILTSDGGHSVAARALETAFSSLKPSLKITTIDFITQMFSPQLNIHIRRVVLSANKYLPTLYRWYCTKIDEILARPQLRNREASFACAALHRYLAVDPPRLIIATHPVPAGAAGEMKRRGLYRGATVT
ncbi:hypothetical protein LM599_00690, partial [Candidatus Acetothermia bacterium]|nr:hypothetical protein [Candidatus Acetothermia bacterium]MCI2427317.1 hypothetical protein [Candidatus Acetothermia bacterium]